MITNTFKQTKERNLVEPSSASAQQNARPIQIAEIQNTKVRRFAISTRAKCSGTSFS